jgi:hypothetical protein
LTLFINPAFSFAFLAGYAVASTYYFTPFLVADYSMLLRNELFYPGGAQIVPAVLVSLILTLALAVLGFLRIRRIDII